MARARVLLADDNPAMIERTRRLLQTDYDVVGAVGDGQSLIEECFRLNPDILVLDISMPVLNGFEAAYLLKARRSRAKIVFLTVHADYDFVRESFAAGGLGYVVKPQLGNDLLQAIHEVLAGRTFVSPTIPQDRLS
jgi:DNA-binding NarL/FixJ family response regulator